MKKFCYACFKEMETELKSVEETIVVKGTPINTISEVRYCTACGGEIFDEKLDSKNLNMAYDLYKKEKGLLLPSEIESIRKKYSLSAKAFSKLLGFGEKTVTRYENGAIQDEAQNNLIFLMQDIYVFRKIWAKSKHVLSKKEIQKTELSLEAGKRETMQLVDIPRYCQNMNQYTTKKFKNSFGSTVLGA